MATPEQPLDAHGLRVFVDWLLEQGFVPNPRTLDRDWGPPNLEFRGKISRVSVLWFRRLGEALQLDIRVEPELMRTWLRLPYGRSAQWDVPLTWSDATRAVRQAVAAAAELDAAEIAYPRGVPLGFAEPPGLTPAVHEVWAALVQFFKKKRLTYTGGTQTFMAPAQWEEAGWGGASMELVVNYEGSEVRQAFTGRRLYEELVELLSAQGFYPEELTSWASGIYPLP